MTTQSKYRDTLLIEIIANKSGFNDLSEWIFETNSYDTYLLVTVGIFIYFGIIDVFNYYIIEKASFITSPNFLAIPSMTIIGIVGLKYIHNGYARAVLRIGIEDTHMSVDQVHREGFKGLVPFRVRIGVYTLALVAYYGFILFVIGIPELIEINGIVRALFGQLILFPFIIIPVLTDLAISYVAIHVLVPQRIENADVGLFYYDPRDLGGFEAIGQLLKRSYYVYTLILLLWFLQTHIPVLTSDIFASPYPAPGPIFQTALSILWFVGVLTISYSMIRMHMIMSSKKRDRIQSLEDELKTVVKNPYNATRDNIENHEEYDNIQKNLEQVRRTKTYPTTFTMWSQIFVSVLLPQALNMVVQLPQ